MTTWGLLREAWRSARSASVPSALLALVVALMTAAALATVGRQAQVEARFRAELESPAARTLTVTALGDALITPAVLDGVRSLDVTELAVGTTTPVDAVNGALGGGNTVAVANIFGDHERSVRLVRGRWPQPGRGEVILPAGQLARLGLAEPSGYLAAAGQQWQVVGAFEAMPPFEHFNQLALSVPAPSRAELSAGVSVHRMHVVASSSATAEASRAATLALIEASPEDLRVAAPLALTKSLRQASAEIAGFGRSLLLLILGVGALMVAVVVLSDVLIRRRDLGRRRTLGITRLGLVGLVAARVAVAAGAGAVAGVAAGWAISPQGAPLGFTVGVAWLNCATACLASLPPAWYAATRDPVAVMRTA
ncbi:permease [Tessaracoccus sp. OH4464_COT-324]|uniref:permease n=1 Tax=Tessaracoccus sp. OH4464_COT-324 TaxID=2491059 RepID=UPI000F6386D8|nr:permease [Tessaracoccus sp. OH4464_COT-324]RRD45662.1 permease [Tessaracoccus sp. OH4464_COT-324]